MTDEPESFDELSAAAQSKAADQASSAVSAVAKHAQRAMDNAKDSLQEPTSTTWALEPLKRPRTSIAVGATLSPATRTCRRRPTI